MLNTTDFNQYLIKNSIIYNYEQYTDHAIRELYKNLDYNRFTMLLDDMKSFEGNYNKHCINFKAGWFKYHLDYKYTDKTHEDYNKNIQKELKYDNLTKKIIGSSFVKLVNFEMGPHVAPHLILTESYYKMLNWSAFVNCVIDAEDSTYDMRIYKKQRENNSIYDVKMILLKPDDFLRIMTKTSCVSIFREYFIALAKIRTGYQQTYMPWLLLQKDNRIDELKADIKSLVASNNQLVISNNQHSKDMKTLMKYAANTNDMVKKLLDFANDFAKMLIPMWIGSSIFKNNLNILLKSNNNELLPSLKYMKMNYIFAFYNKLDDAVISVNEAGDDFIVTSELRIYVRCTNFYNVRETVEKLFKKEGKRYYALKPVAIGLSSNDIDLELSNLRSMQVIPNNYSLRVDTCMNTKLFSIGVDFDDEDIMNYLFNTIANGIKNSRLQSHQIKLDTMKSDPALTINNNILNVIDDIDNDFFSKIYPYCQAFLDEYTNEIIHKNGKTDYEYTASNRKHYARINFNNVKYTNQNNSLLEINVLINKQVDTSNIIKLVQDGVITEDDTIPFL